MRRRIRERLITMALGMALTAAMAGIAWAQPVSAQSSRLSVISVEGENAWIAKSGRKEEKAAAGVPLRQGQILRTGESTGMYLNADGDKIIQLGSTTRAVVTEATDNKLRITLEEGFLLFDVKRKLAEGEELYFDTAHASMNVRGTSGFVLTSPGDPGANNGGTVARLLTGAVEYTSPGGQTGTLTPGNALVISSDARPDQRELVEAANSNTYVDPETGGLRLKGNSLSALLEWEEHIREGMRKYLDSLSEEERRGAWAPFFEDSEPDAEDPNTVWSDFSERKAELEAKSASLYGKPEVESSEGQDGAYDWPAVDPEPEVPDGVPQPLPG